MVRATTSLETVRHDLKTAPPDGFVELRPMTYGQYLHRRDMATRMAVSGARNAERLDIDMMQEAVTQYEFSVCVADHNLEDENGRKLSLSQPADFAKLDPKIGQEISQLIADMTQWEDPKSDESVGDGHREGDTVSEGITPQH